MKKKVVIVTRRMIMGGIEKALLSMINLMPKEEYEITILVMGYGGELETEIPKHVQMKCIYGDEKTTLEKVWNITKKGKIIRAIKTVFYTILAKRSKSIFQQELYHSKMLPIEEKEYDLAIAYHVPASFPVVYVINNVKAKVKVAWIHSDVSQHEKALTWYQKYYDSYDKIYCVSKYAMYKFNEIYPHLMEKTSVFYNIMDKSNLQLSSSLSEGFLDEFNGIRILTIGRLCKQKGQDIIPSIVQKLKSEGYNFKWYCIGDGETRIQLERQIRKYNIKNNMILLGTISNPYSYIKETDIYVQPSRHEGYCLTLAEARVFNVPIVTTDFVGAREQIENGKNGLITKFSEDELYAAVKRLILNPELRYQFIENLKSQNIDTSSEIIKLNECFPCKTLLEV